MLNISGRLEQQLDESRYCNWNVRIIFKDKREVTLGDDDLVSDACRISNGVGSSELAIGQCMSKLLELEIYNDDWKYDDYDFFGAVIYVSCRYEFEDGTGETLNIGKYTVTEPEAYGSAVSIVAHDDFYKADVAFSYNGERNAQELFNNACAKAGLVPTQVPDLLAFPTEAFDSQGMSCRHIIGYCAMVCGGNAIVNDGVVQIVNYIKPNIDVFDDADGGIFDSSTPYSSGARLDGGYYDHYTDSSVPYASGASFRSGEFADFKMTYTTNDAINIRCGTASIFITGVQTTYKDGEQEIPLLQGREGYVISVSNPIVGNDRTKCQRLLTNLYAKLGGMEFRTCDIDIPSFPPMEVCDMIYIEDHNGTSHRTFLTDVDIAFHGFTTLKCAAEDAVKAEYGKTSYFTTSQLKTIRQARELAKEDVLEHDEAVRRLGDLAINALGLHTTMDRDADGGIIYYMHNKPNLNESDVRYMMSSSGFMVWNNNTKRYESGFTSKGEVVANILSVIGINAEWIRTGTLSVGGVNNQMGIIDIYDGAGKKVGTISNTGITLNNGTKYISVNNEVIVFYDNGDINNPNMRIGPNNLNNKAGYGIKVGSDKFFAISTDKVGTNEGYLRYIYSPIEINVFGITIPANSHAFNALVMFLENANFEKNITAKGNITASGKVASKTVEASDNIKGKTFNGESLYVRSGTKKQVDITQQDGGYDFVCGSCNLGYQECNGIVMVCGHLTLSDDIPSGGYAHIDYDVKKPIVDVISACTITNSTSIQQIANIEIKASDGKLMLRNINSQAVLRKGLSMTFSVTYIKAKE